MKRILFLFFVLSLTAVSYSQNASVAWGDEFKMKKGSTDLEVINVDANGVFVKESHRKVAYFSGVRESATLIKLDKNLAEEYRQDFNKELKGKEYERFFFLKDKLFLLATDYYKKDKKLVLFAAPVDKKTGELSGEWQEVTSWQKEEKKDDINFNVTYNGDSTKMVTVSSIEGREKNNYEVREFDDKLKMIGKPIELTNEFEPKTFQLEDVLYITNGNVVLVGRVFEYQEGKKKKAKFLDFKNYNVRIYNPQGALVKEINSEINAKWLMSTKVIQIPGKEIVLAGFYCDQKKAKEVNGMLVQRINPDNGDIISTSLKPLTTAMIDAVDDNDEGDDADDDESKKERRERKKLEKMQEDEEGFSRHMKFRDFIPAPDGGLVILAEKYNVYQYTTISYSGGGVGGFSNTRTTTYRVYECGDLMMSKVDKEGNISWLHILPKNQKETIEVGSGYGTGFFYYTNFFETGFNWPFYAGFGILTGPSDVTIIFNDRKKNSDVLQAGQKAKLISSFRKSQCYGVKLDLVTGKYKRDILFDNDDVPTAMPRLGKSLGKDLYIVGKEDRFLGKTKIAVARVSIKK